MASTIAFNPAKITKLIGLLSEIQNKAFANQEVEMAEEPERIELEKEALGELAAARAELSSWLAGRPAGTAANSEVLNSLTRRLAMAIEQVESVK